MDYLPVFIDLRARRCVIAGGGAVGHRKARMLLRAGASVVIVAPHIVEPLRRLVESGDVEWCRARYEEKFVAGAALVIAATGDATVNARVAADARAANVFCNVVDDRSHSNAIMPAIVDRSPFVIAISSAGNGADPRAPLARTPGAARAAAHR